MGVMIDLIEGKNTHLEHAEDDIINNGYDGGVNAINFLSSLKDMLSFNFEFKKFGILLILRFINNFERLIDILFF